MGSRAAGARCTSTLQRAAGRRLGRSAWPCMWRACRWRPKEQLGGQPAGVAHSSSLPRPRHMSHRRTRGAAGAGLEDERIRVVHLPAGSEPQHCSWQWLRGRAEPAALLGQRASGHAEPAPHHLNSPGRSCRQLAAWAAVHRTTHPGLEGKPTCTRAVNLRWGLACPAVYACPDHIFLHVAFPGQLTIGQRALLMWANMLHAAVIS